ncbi:hypothetical protein LEP1GSC076_0746 [Leptospira sp. Fiocruz LV4135]|nr:hypothetical protein LEP1GSC076_3319 [Leptospira sp. Fiocruz LV4135]EMI65860.1 hypothetical protein LEP1GSC076_0746 [Leptospira sp. Fiocruz LV4135]
MQTDRKEAIKECESKIGTRKSLRYPNWGKNGNRGKAEQ